MHVDSNHGISKIEYFENGVQIDIPPQNSFFIRMLIATWGAGWILGEFFAVRSVVVDKNLIAWLWLIGWTIAGTVMIGLILWMFFRRELIVLGEEWLTVECQVFFYKHTRSYETVAIRNMRVGRKNENNLFNDNRIRRTVGRLIFNYGLQTCRFGMNLDPIEAKSILDQHFAKFKGQAAHTGELIGYEVPRLNAKKQDAYYNKTSV